MTKLAIVIHDSEILPLEDVVLMFAEGLQWIKEEGNLGKKLIVYTFVCQQNTRFLSLTFTSYS